jgi:hypothetical protein
MEIVEIISIKPYISLSRKYTCEDMETQMQEDKYQYTRLGILKCEGGNNNCMHDLLSYIGGHSERD